MAFTYDNFAGQRSVPIPVDIVSFGPLQSIVEMGTIVEAVVLQWALNKNVTSIVLDGVTLPTNTASKAMVGPFTANNYWTLAVSDEDSRAQKKGTLTFLNQMYWDVVEAAPVDSDGILALTNSDFAQKIGDSNGPNGGRAISFSTLTGLLPCIAYPSRFGAPRVMTGAINPRSQLMQYEFSSFTDFTVSVVAFTNRSGFAENYNVVVFNTPSAAQVTPALFK